MVFISTLSYSITDKQIELIKKELNQLQQKEYKKSRYIKSNLKASNIGSYLEYKEISLHPEAFTQAGQHAGTDSRIRLGYIGSRHAPDSGDCRGMVAVAERVCSSRP